MAYKLVQQEWRDSLGQGVGRVFGGEQIEMGDVCVFEPESKEKEIVLRVKILKQ